VFVAVGTEPTREETEAAFARQEMYMTYLYQSAVDLANNRKLVDIAGDHRIAAQWLGRDEIWSKTGVESPKDKCPFCGVPVMADAYFCTGPASHPLRELPSDLARLLALSKGTSAMVPPPPEDKGAEDLPSLAQASPAQMAAAQAKGGIRPPIAATR
jgi:hypothetical protein